MEVRVHRGRSEVVVAALVAIWVALVPGSAGAEALLVADGQAFKGHGGGVIRVYPDGRQVIVSSNNTASGPQFVDPTGVVEGGPGDGIFVADRNADGGSGAVFNVDLSTGHRTEVAGKSMTDPGFADPRSVSAAPDGTVYVADPSARGGKGAIFAIGPGSLTPRQLDLPYPLAWDDPVELFVDPLHENILYVTDRGAFSRQGAVWKVDVVANTVELLSTNGMPGGGGTFVDPFGIWFGPSSDPNNIFITDTEANGGGGALFQVDLATGVRTPLSANGFPAGGPDFVDPFSVTFDQFLSKFIISDTNASGGGGALITVDPATGGRDLLAPVPRSPNYFVDPFSVALESNPPPEPEVTPTSHLPPDPDGYDHFPHGVHINQKTGAKVFEIGPDHYSPDQSDPADVINWALIMYVQIAGGTKDHPPTAADPVKIGTVKGESDATNGRLRLKLNHKGRKLIEQKRRLRVTLDGKLKNTAGKARFTAKLRIVAARR